MKIIPKRLPTLESFLCDRIVSEAAIMNTDTLAIHKYNKSFLLYDYNKMDAALSNYDYDKVDESIVGVVETRYNNKHNASEIDSIWGAKGYGPFLFLIAMEFAKPKILL